MGFLDKAKGKLSKVVDDHGDKISTGIDKAAALADKRTGGKHHTKIVKAQAKGKQALGNLDDKNDGKNDGLR